MSTAVIAAGITPTYRAGVPTIDIAETSLYDIKNLAGLGFWGRGDAITANAGGGYVAQLDDKRTASARKLRQAAGQTATFTPSTTTGYLGNRATLLGDTATDGRMVLSDAIIPATGPWAIYMAIHMLSGGYHRLLGNDSASLMGLDEVGGELRFRVANSGAGASLLNTPSGGLAGRDCLLGVHRRIVGASTKLALRYKFSGTPWVDVEAASFCTSDGSEGAAARTIATSLVLGIWNNTPTASYAFNARLGQIMVFPADVAAIRSTIESYLVNYHGIA